MGGPRRDYEADTQRGPRKAAKPSDKEIDAAELFAKTGDYGSFLKALGTHSRTKADSSLRRVIAWKGQGGVKSIRRTKAR